MSYRQIFKEIYKENRKFILGYLTFALVFSVFMYSGAMGFAANRETLELMRMGGSTTAMMVILLGQVVPSLDPAVALAASCIISIISDFVTLPGAMSDADFGLLATSWIFRVLVLLYSACVILPKHLNVSSILGLEIEEISKYLSLALVVINVFPSLLSINAFAVNAADVMIMPKTPAPSPFMVVFNFIAMVAGLVCYYFIRYFVMFINIISIPVRALVPGSSLAIEMVKNIFVVAMVIISHTSKIAAIIMMLVILVVSIFLFKKAYITVRYFKNVYVKPVIKKLFNDNKQLSLVDEKMPKGMKKLVEDRDIVMAIPAYPVKKWNNMEKLVKYDKWWLIKEAEGKAYLLKRNGFKKELITLELESDTKIFINKAFRFINIFTVSNEENIGKKFRLLPKVIDIVISKEYSNQYENIVMNTNYVEYANYSDMLNKQRESEKAAAKAEKKPLFSWGKNNAQN